MKDSAALIVVPVALAELELVDTPISSDLDKFVAKARQIAESSPEILLAIEKDQMEHGLQKKAARLADQEYFESQNPPLANLKIEPARSAVPTELCGGRPRMPAMVVFVLLLLRGWLGGPKSLDFRLVLRESITLRQFFESHGLKVPGLSTVADNLNAVSHHTQQLILRRELYHAQEENLDDFSTCRIDSTATESNSKYPTDSGLIAAFALRLMAFFNSLAKLGLPDLSQQASGVQSAGLAREIELFSKQIGIISGKQGVKEQRTGLYQKIYSRVDRLVKKLKLLQPHAAESIEQAQAPPSLRQRLEALNQQFENDLTNIATIREYSAERVLEGKSIAAERKVLSVSDESAGIIKKGGWNTIFGYRPQLAFSGKGLVTAHVLPLGNAADAGQLQTVLHAVLENTKTVPLVVTVDDGYASGPVRAKFLNDHATEKRPIVFSVAGSKGRAIIEEANYQSDAYRDARHDRSAAESCVFVLKQMHDYGEVIRRGLQAVRHEQMCKVLAYNVRRMVRLEQDAAKAQRKALLEKQNERLQRQAA
jgi:hypothetical protein